MSKLCLLVLLLFLLDSSDSIPLKSKNRHRTLSKRMRSSSGPNDGPFTSDRIPRVCQVFRYDLTITPYMEFDGLVGQRQDYTFDGEMTMDFQITNQTDYLPLRSESLKIDKLQLKYYGMEDNLVLNALEINYETSEVKLIPLYGFEIGQNYTLFVKYSGQIFNGGSIKVEYPEGLYYDNYTDPSGNYKQVVATFFEPTNSRKMFPSLDDPHFKAIFGLKLVHPKNAKVYANTEIIDQIEFNQYRYKTTFKDTPLLSTYLLAFAIGDFANATALTRSNKPVNAMAISHLNAGLQNAANIGAKCVDGMENLTGIAYPLSKLDNVDMVSMGYAEITMENFGMIVYKQVLITHPKIASSSLRIVESVVICHEISHQWFGDLVTADFWGVEFLHESFANFFEYRAVQYSLNQEDKDHMETLFVQSKEDGLKTSFNGYHAVVSDQSYFDAITYESGGAILRMLEAALGSSTFYKALNIYLTKNAYGNADQNTLIDAFEEALNNKPVCGKLRIRQVMNDFLLKRYYPVVSISTSNGNYKFSQHSANVNDPSTWNIPLIILDTKLQKSSVIWLLNDSQLCTNDGFVLDSKTTYIFNYRSYTFARFCYSFELLGRIFAVDTKQLDGATQAGLCYDQLDAESQSGANNGPNPLSTRLAKNFLGDPDGKVDPIIIELYNFMNPSDPLTSFNVYKNFNWTTTSLIGGDYNAVLFQKAIKYNVGVFKQKGRQLFRQFMSDCLSLTDLENCNKIPPDARATVYCAGIIDSDPRSNSFFQDYANVVINLSEKYPYFENEQSNMAYALICSHL